MEISSEKPNQVTIGICTRNNESTISTALRSILVLNYPKSLLRVVLVDGLSTDQTLSEAMAVLRDSHVEWLILSDSGKGLGYARQLIVDKSESEYLAFIDADQSLDADWLNASLSFLASHPNAAGVRGRQCITNGLPLPSALENYIKAVEDKEAGLQTRIDNFGLGGTLFRRQSILEAGGFDSSFTRCAEDTDLALKLQKKGWKILNSKEAVFYHSPRTSWRSLYNQYNSWGRDVTLVGGKHGELAGELNRGRVLSESLSTFLVAVKYVPRAYESSRDIRSLLLPLQCLFKRAAYVTGFLLSIESR